MSEQAQHTPTTPQPSIQPIHATCGCHRTDNLMAVVSMVCGIIAIPSMLFFGIGIGPAVAGVVTGHLSMRQIGQSDRVDTGGRAYAKAGLIMSYVALGILVVLVIVVGISAIVSAASGAYMWSYPWGAMPAS